MRNDDARSPVSRPPVSLQVHGKGLLVSGDFSGWQSRLVLGPDLDDVGVSLFVDSTSVGPAQPRDLTPADRLFSFRSRSVESRGKGRFRVIGEFAGAEPGRELTVDFETPLGHTALIALSFTAKKQDFGAHWQTLVESASLFGLERQEADGPQREAAGWLTVPNVAAA
jgi:hypothetical protein